MFFSFEKRGRATSLRMTLLTWKILFLHSFTRDPFRQRQWNLTAALHNWDLNSWWQLEGDVDTILFYLSRYTICICQYYKKYKKIVKLHGTFYWMLSVVDFASVSSFFMVFCFSGVEKSTIKALSDLTSYRKQVKKGRQFIEFNRMQISSVRQLLCIYKNPKLDLRQEPHVCFVGELGADMGGPKKNSLSKLFRVCIELIPCTICSCLVE